VLSTDPQKQYADAVIQVLPTQLIPDDNEGKVLRVRMIMKEGVPFFEPVYLFDEGSTISWIPCGRKLTCSYPGIKFFYGPDTYYGNEVSTFPLSHFFSRLVTFRNQQENFNTKFYSPSAIQEGFISGHHVVEGDIFHADCCLMICHYLTIAVCMICFFVIRALDCFLFISLQ
jgi:hypothetical protein